ncbi:MAG: nuclear transport factor 2 family protein [Rhodobacteraceae bacterium]|nr:nuclear transport factor 2 family protein [Paracoccaceae bacterium]
MTIEDIAKTLVEYCNTGQEARGLDELYAPHAVSVEAMVPPDSDRGPVTEGIEGIRGKHAWWAESFDTHSTSAEGPYIHGDRFAIRFAADATEKASGQRFQMTEVGLYTVADGNIVREEFFFMPFG